MESSKYVMPAYILVSECNAWRVSQNKGQPCNTFNGCNTLQHAATRCNTLQHAATEYRATVQYLYR